MDVEECIRTRRSIRKFLDVRIETDKISQILEAGKMAPTAGNLQNQKIIIVTDEELKKKVADACLQQYWIATAPVILVIFSDNELQTMHYGKRGEMYAVQSCAAVAMNMILMANSLGIASCWVGAFDDGALKRELNIPDKFPPQIVLPLGYPDEKVPVPPRKSLYSHVFIEKYDNRIKDIDAALGYWSGVTARKAREAKKAVEKAVEKRTGKLSERIKGLIKAKRKK